MRHFRAGTIERHRVPKHFQRFSPVEALHSLEEVNLEALRAAGKSLILMDVDNTLLPWRSEDIPESTTAWLEKARGLGFRLCILSNTRNPERLSRLSGKMGVEFIRDKFKPSPRMYELALEKYQVGPESAIMVGDQLLTDIWGANRADIDAIWVKPIGRKEFVGTRYISRNVERVIGRVLHNHFQTPSGDMAVGPGVFKHEIVRQFLKFAMVGAVATVVDLGLHFLLMFGVPGLRDSVGRWVLSQPALANTFDSVTHAAYPVLKVVTVLLATVVSYLLNRWFTFQATHEKANLRQVGKFFTVALAAMVINTSVGTLAIGLIHGSDRFQWTVASVTGMAAGVFFNFAGQRLWTFRRNGAV
ncbi:MAG: YqeG family HAD IIIA-type phosphatase [Armatimonadetes bacterium]|nr:YqeG family HAD IIIA-type phosphatase [Armatimonadota bacterium]MBX3108830.1 YqeG family HAD IIIA-type phosphatase [Fimbriimonadaceae bacterium]